MSLSKRSKITIVAFVFATILVPILVVVTAKSQFGLDEMMGPELDAGFIATWPETADGMVRLADVNKDDLVYDLGCGDGRIVIAAITERRRDQAEHPALGRLPIRLPDFKLGIYPPGLQGRSQPEQQRRHH